MRDRSLDMILESVNIVIVTFNGLLTLVSGHQCHCMQKTSDGGQNSQHSYHRISLHGRDIHMRSCLARGNTHCHWRMTHKLTLCDHGHWCHPPSWSPSHHVSPWCQPAQCHHTLAEGKSRGLGEDRLRT